MSEPSISERIEDIARDLYDSSGCGCCFKQRDWDEAMDALRTLAGDVVTVDALLSDEAVSAAHADFLPRTSAPILPYEVRDAMQAAINVVIAGAKVNGPDPAVYNYEFQRVRADHAIAESEQMREALSKLVELKDGPRDERYEREKPLAWQAAREALSRTES